MFARTKSAFTIVELLVSILIVVILMGMLLPAFGSAWGRAQQLICANNLRQIGQALQMYVMEHNGLFPIANDPVSTNPYYWLWMGRGWRSLIVPYLSSDLKVLYCPADLTAPGQWENTSYGYSMSFYHSPFQINAMRSKSATWSNPQPSLPQKVTGVAYPARKVIMAEWLSNHRRLQKDDGWWTWKGTRNYLFADGHIEFLPANKILPANDGLPDVNLTVDGIAGMDVY